jgi:hypothetical protein
MQPRQLAVSEPLCASPQQVPDLVERIGDGLAHRWGGGHDCFGGHGGRRPAKWWRLAPQLADDPLEQRVDSPARAGG